MYPRQTTSSSRGTLDPGLWLWVLTHCSKKAQRGSWVHLAGCSGGLADRPRAHSGTRPRFSRVGCCEELREGPLGARNWILVSGGRQNSSLITTALHLCARRSASLLVSKGGRLCWLVHGVQPRSPHPPGEGSHESPTPFPATLELGASVWQGWLQTVAPFGGLSMSSFVDSRPVLLTLEQSHFYCWQKRGTKSSLGVLVTCGRTRRRKGWEMS